MSSADQEPATEQGHLQSLCLLRGSWQSAVHIAHAYGETVQPHKAAASVGLSRPRHSCWSAGRCCSNDCKREGCQLNFNLRRHVLEPGCPWVYLHTYESLGACSVGSCRAEHAASDDGSSVGDEQSEANVQQCRIADPSACPIHFTVLEIQPNSPTRAGSMQVN